MITDFKITKVANGWSVNILPESPRLCCIDGDDLPYDIEYQSKKSEKRMRIADMVYVFDTFDKVLEFLKFKEKE